MGFLGSLDISASGLTAQRMRMDVISQNLANASTTRTAEGETYRRRVVVMGEKRVALSPFSAYLDKVKTYNGARGVNVVGIATDMSEFTYEYDPTHPDANAEGYVAYPNVDEAAEMVDMMAATRAYEANITAFNAAKAMAMKALEIGR